MGGSNLGGVGGGRPNPSSPVPMGSNNENQDKDVSESQSKPTIFGRIKHSFTKLGSLLHLEDSSSKILQEKTFSKLDHDPLIKKGPIGDRINLDRVEALINEVNQQGLREGGGQNPLWEISDDSKLYQLLTEGPIDYDPDQDYDLEIESFFVRINFDREDPATETAWKAILNDYNEEVAWLCQDEDVASNFHSQEGPRFANTELFHLFKRSSENPDPAARERCWEFARCCVLLVAIGTSAFE